MSTRRFDSGEGIARATDDDVEGHGMSRAPDGLLRTAEDDVEGHTMGMMNPSLARDLAGAKEREIARQSSRQSLLSEARRALKKKG